MNDQRMQTLLLVVLAIAVLLFGTSLLIAVINLGTQIAASWLVILVQVAVAILVLLVVLGALGKFHAWVVSEIANLHRKHAELLKQIKQRTPWFIALALLVSQAVLAVADKSFEGKELPTVAVTLVLILLFFMANEFMVRDSKIFRGLGFVIWFAAVMALPFFVWVDREFSTTVVVKQLMAFPLEYKAFYGLCLPIFLLLPVLFATRKDA